MDQILMYYLPLLVAIVTFLDVIAGYLPDRWVPYIGFIRRVVTALKDAAKKNPLQSIVLLFISVLIFSCAVSQVKTPSICGEAAFKKADLRAWALDKYSIDVETDEMLLCEIANARDIHLEATGDLLMLMDVVAVRANAYSRKQAEKVFTELRDTFLAAARGITALSAGDLRDIAYQYAGDYPELSIALKYTDTLKVPEYSGRIPSTLDFVALAWWCGQNISVLK